MPGKGTRSQHLRGTRGGTATVPPCACNSRWHCSATLPTCGNVRKGQPLALQSGSGTIPPKTTPARASENNRQLHGMMSRACANVLQERRFLDVASKSSATSGTILHRRHCNCRDLQTKGSLKGRALWWLARERDRILKKKAASMPERRCQGSAASAASEASGPPDGLMDVPQVAGFLSLRRR